MGAATETSGLLANQPLSSAERGQGTLQRSGSSSGSLHRSSSRGTLIKGSSGTFAVQGPQDQDAKHEEGDNGGSDGGMTPRLMLAVVVASLGSSLQFGYGTGVMNNSESFIRGAFDAAGKPYTLHMWAATVSMFGWGGLVGAMLGTKVLSYWMGRKAIMALGSGIVFISSVLLAFGPQWYYLATGRLLIGIVAGIATGVVPTYLSEISPVRLRGGVGTAHQLGITLGILLAEVLSTPSLHLFGSFTAWPWLFLPPAALAFLQLIALPFIPESPAYLYVHDGDDAARAALEKLRGSQAKDKAVVDRALHLIHEEAELQQEEQTADGREYGVADLLCDRTLRKQLVVGVVVQLMMQLSGIDALFYYSTDVFKLAGVRDPQLATTFLGTINVLVTIWALRYMDVAGRRTLLLWSWSGMLCSYILLTAALLMVTGGTAANLTAWENVSVAAMTGVIIFFAFGPGCIAWYVIMVAGWKRPWLKAAEKDSAVLSPWCFVGMGGAVVSSAASLIIAEIFPLHARESAMSVGMSINWIANWAVAFTFPLLLRAAREWAFLVFVGTTALFLVFTFKFVPETKNRTVLEITRVFHHMRMPFVGAADEVVSLNNDVGSVNK